MAQERNVAVPEVIIGRRPKRPLWVTLSRIARQKPLGTVSASIIFLLILIALSADLLSPYNPESTRSAWLLYPPSREHLMGGDYLGRDILSNVIHGARLSLTVGIMSVFLGTIMGTIIGTLSAYFGGRSDFIIQRFVDAWMSFPTLILAISIVAFLGPSALNVILAIATTIIPTTSRVVRGAVLSVKENQYIEAVRAIGASNLRIMLRHVLPNVMAPVIILASIALGNAIIAEASLSFLGLGTPPPASSWGRMLGTEAIRYMTDAPWILLFPALAISIVVLSFNLLGDTVRDVLDPRLRGSR